MNKKAEFSPNHKHYPTRHPHLQRNVIDWRHCWQYSLPPGYTMFRKDRNKGWNVQINALAKYISSDLGINFPPGTAMVQQHSYQVTGSTIILICALNKTPNNQEAEITKALNDILQILNSKHHIWIGCDLIYAGSIKIWWHPRVTASSLKNVVDLSQCLKTVTYSKIILQHSHTIENTASILDLFLTNFPLW